MTLPASGTIAISNFSTELGLAATANNSSAIIYNNTKVGQQSYAMNAYYSKTYYKKTNAGNCTVANCAVAGNCTFQCVNCSNCTAVNCVNCDAVSYIQTDCNCTTSYNCSPVTNVLYDCNCNCSTDTGSCFLAGSVVVMADGSLRLIEDVKIGEYVRGAYGEANKVLAIDRPLLGNRQVFLINGEHRTTDEHSHMRQDRTLGPIHMKAWLLDRGARHDVVVDQVGTVESWLVPGIEDVTNIRPLEIGDELWTVNGAKVLSSIDSFVLPADTLLYNFVLDGSHTYFVEGYCVTGWVNGRDFDYASWTNSSDPWTSDDYRNQTEE